MPYGGHLVGRLGPRRRCEAAGAVRHQGEGAAAGHRPGLVGECAAHGDGGLQLRTGPVEVAGTEGEDAQLVVEVGLFGNLTGDPGGLLARPERLLPGAPAQPRRQCGSGTAGQQDGRAGLASLAVGDEAAHRGDDRVGLGDGPLRGDRGVGDPPGVVLGGRTGVGGGLFRVPAGLQLGEDTGGEPVAGAGRGEQSAAREFTESGVRVGVAHEGRQMGLVGHLAAERDGEAQGLAGRLAEPGGEQDGGRRPFAEARQRHVQGLGGGRFGNGRSVVRAWLEIVVLVEGRGVRVEQVALAQQRSGLDEAERQPLGLEPEVARPVPLVLGEGALDDLGQQLQRGGAAEAGEEDLLQVRVDTGRGEVGCGAEEEGALGGGLQEPVERGPSDLQVVDDHDGADGADEGEQLLGAGAVERGEVRRVEEAVQQVGGGAPVAAEADDAVGGQVRAVGGDGVEERGAAGSGLAGEADAAAAGQQAHQPLALVLAFQQGSCGAGGPAGTGGAPARSWAARSAGVRRAGASVSYPGGQASTSLPSTGLTVSRRSPTVTWTTRTCCGVGWPKSAALDSRDGRRRPSEPLASCPYSSGPWCVGSINKSPRRVALG